MPYEYTLPPIQTEREHDAFIAILKSEGVRSYLEIGSMWGQSLWKVAHALPKGSRVVAVDSMVDRPTAKPSLQACVDELRRRSYDAHWINGDSTSQATVAAVKTFGQFDALF